jgi:LysR family transcriptional regulator, regulator for metE and metH
MEIRHLKLIKVLAEEGGITKSLEKLFLTQSAVSHQLRDIEQRLGTKIFYRAKNQWQLTEEGKILYNTANNILSEMDNALNQIKDLKNGEAGTIRISTECYTSYHWLPSFMQNISILYPNLDIKIVIEATHKPLQKLMENELDVAITSDPLDDKSLKYIELFKDEMWAVVSEEHPWSTRKYVTADDFSNEILIIHSYPLETVTVYQHFLKDYDKMPKQILAIPLTEVALEMVKAKMGVTCMPLWALKPFVTSSTLKLVKIGKKGLIRTHYATIRLEDAKKKYITDFIENLKEELSQ